jgi:hypothetical protein
MVGGRLQWLTFSSPFKRFFSSFFRALAVSLSAFSSLFLFLSCIEIQMHGQLSEFTQVLIICDFCTTLLTLLDTYKAPLFTLSGDASLELFFSPILFGRNNQICKKIVSIKVFLMR